jgi:hypothetical protein
VNMQTAKSFHARGLIRDVMTGIGEWLGNYDPVRGLVADDPALTELAI